MEGVEGSIISMNYTFEVHAFVITHQSFSKLTFFIFITYKKDATRNELFADYLKQCLYKISQELEKNK